MVVSDEPRFSFICRSMRVAVKVDIQLRPDLNVEIQLEMLRVCAQEESTMESSRCSKSVNFARLIIGDGSATLLCFMMLDSLLLP